MPFRPELRFLYRTLRAHIEQSFPEVTVERGDDSVLTTTILEKIGKLISQADVVIADCSGRNPNVFYELGMAHALGKPVVLITSDAVEQAPTDIRAFDFISYATCGPDEFLAKLDNALQSVVGNPFAALFPEAVALFEQFCKAKHRDLEAVGRDDFIASMSARQKSGQLLPKNPRGRAEYLVRRLLGAEPEIEILIDLKDWLDQVCL
jgi:Nucleoside 2-deoxyribosyltransferase